MHPQDPTRRVVTFRIEEIPDPSYPLYLVAARGDVLSAVAKGFEHLMRTVGFFTPKSASLAIMMNFNPTASGNKPQSRLRLYMQSVSTNLETSTFYPWP